MSETNYQAFNFEEWMNLAKSDPEEFEKRRKEMINNLICSAPAERQQRLRGLQWRIDMERKKCSNPLSACIRLSEMMWDFVYAENGFLNTLKKLGATDPKVKIRKNEVKSAEILPFNAKSR